MTDLEPAVGRRRTEARRSPHPGSTEQLVLACAALLVGAQVIFRGWALYPSWFFTDDYRLLHDARSQGLSWAYLVRPFDSQLMPFGRLVVWLVSTSHGLDWTLAVTLTLLLQLAAGCACVWMLVTLFGARWGVLAPLTLYLTSVISLPALMWWAASVNQVPMQVAFFVAVGAWVRHLRTRSTAWLVVTLLAVGFGLLCYVKVLFLVPVLAYFARGTLRQRVVGSARTYWPAVAVGAVLTVAYVVHYVSAVPQPFRPARENHVLEVADSMLGTILPTGLLGGPWHWYRTSPPIVLGSPPVWTVHLSWVLVVLVVLYSVLRRARAGRGWVLLASYSLALFALLATSRGQLYGRFAGLEYRYLTDVVCVLALTVGLVFLELQGAPGSSRPRPAPLLTVRLHPGVAPLVVAVVAVGGLQSSASYVGYWHHDNAGRAYVKNLQAALAGSERVPALAAQTLPGDVMPDYTKPDNDSRRFTGLLQRRVSFPATSDRLQVIDGAGNLVPARIRTGVRSRPGPQDGCGWKVRAGGRDIALTGRTFDWRWWLRIGYLSSSDSSVVVTAGDSRRATVVRKGLHSLYVRADGRFDTVSVSGLADGVTLCVDTIEVGDAVPPEGP
jgi:hypothetical protein